MGLTSSPSGSFLDWKGLVQARKDLSKALAANLDTGGDPVTATRIWIETPPVDQQPTKILQREAEDLHIEEDTPGFLELLAEMETGNQSLVQTISAATSIVNDISTIYTEATESVRQADARKGGAAARLAIAEQTAAKLDEQAARLEVVSGEYARTVDRIEPGLQYLLGRLAEEPEQLSQVPEFPGQIQTLCLAAQTSIDNTLAMRNNAMKMGKASRSLKRVGHQLAQSFKRFADTSARIAGWADLVGKIPGSPAASYALEPELA